MQNLKAMTMGVVASIDFFWSIVANAAKARNGRNSAKNQYFLNSESGLWRLVVTIGKIPPTAPRVLPSRGAPSSLEANSGSK
jgi:hypothetical protein